jgi:hypothetical protein
MLVDRGKKEEGKENYEKAVILTGNFAGNTQRMCRYAPT